MDELCAVILGPWATKSLIIWNLKIAAMGTMVGLSCGLVGCFAALRRMAMLGDAVSHGILPGIVIAYLLTDSLSLGATWVGACLAGLTCGISIEWLRSKTRLREDAAMGLTFTSLFALGIVLLSLQAGQVHLDPSCILHGEIGLTPLAADLRLWGENWGNVALWSMGTVCLICVLSSWLFYRFLLVTSFDANLARSLGMPVALIQYGLMLLLALAVVAAFESVGVVLVVAMMILPYASASFLFDRLPTILLSCPVFAALYAGGGIHLAYWMDFPIAAAMALAGGAIFVPCCLFGPKGGALRGRAFSRETVPESNA